MFKRVLAVGVTAAATLAIAPAAHAAPPVHIADSAEGDVFLFDCGDFDLRDHFTFESHGILFLDANGNATRIVQHVAGTDTFYNSVTGKSVTGTINSGEQVNFVDGFVTQSGSIGRITVPGMGVVFFDVGKYVVTFGEGVTFLAGNHHAFFDEDYQPLCDLLA